MKSGQLRERFLQFFERHGHRSVASHSLIPPADPTLLFVNAGMVQFKDVFVGLRKVDYSRAASSQKCLRVSGKHNDLENVGRTARHHTFFEMLGNFSFGDYFKKDAIRFAYDFLVHEVGLDASRCYYTVFGGDAADGIPPDEEAEGLWRDAAGVGPERILRFGKKDNFWAMGETGPCGPCSEILYDRGPGPWACGRPDCAPGCDCDRFMEIWNLVFMQFERKEPGGKLFPLPAPSIDTGMGLERLASVTQKTASNYETDLFMPLIESTIALLRREAGRTIAYGRNPEDDVGLRVIADHARAAAFLVADGVYPDNEGRGYIARLLMRRAVRFGRKLGFTGKFFFDVCDRVADLMAAAYPELEKKRELIRKVVSLEEDAFNQTYDDGCRALEGEMERLRAKGESRLSGSFLFWMHDERGMQPDLVEVIAAEQKFTIDRTAYDALMEEKRLTSGKASCAASHRDDVELFRCLGSKLGATRFVGYDADRAETRVLALVAGDAQVQALPAGAEGLALLEQTPFYAEGGGQVGDTGTLSWSGGRARVLDTQRVPGDLFLHRVQVLEGTLVPDNAVNAVVDLERKAGIRAHHSATHLLHQALFEVLGEHVKQEGSVVRDDLLRFDFRHFSPLTLDEIQAIEEKVATRVLENSQVETRVVPVEEAVASGARAFFGEKYGALVRLVSMGNGKSRELCGGTHACRTGDIGTMKIVRQEAVSSGVRRIYAVCHLAAVRHMAERERRTATLAALLKAPSEELEVKTRKLIERASTLEKEVRELEQKLLAAAAAPAESGAALEDEHAGFKAAWSFVPDADDAKVRSMSDLLRDRIRSGVVLVGGIKDGKLVLVAARTPGVPEAVHAGRIVGELARLIEGRGGGKPDFGQAGGGVPERWDDAVAMFRDLVRKAAHT